MQECGWVGLPNTPPLIDLLLSPCNPSWPNNPNASTPYPKLPATHKLSDCLAFPDVRAGGDPAPQIRESTQPKHATRSHTSFTCWDHQIYKHKTSSHVTLLMMTVCHMSGKLLKSKPTSQQKVKHFSLCIIKKRNYPPYPHLCPIFQRLF